jgi:hypothetical protein
LEGIAMEESELKIIYECWAGSHAYGTSTPESDEDFRGIAIAPLSYYLGLNFFEDMRTETPDLVIYDILKFVRLAADCNPNIIELLFTDEAQVLSMTESGKLLRANRDLFVTKRARHTFMGYAMSQLQRIRRHRAWLLHPIESKPTRAQFDLPEHKLVTKDQQEAFIWVIANLLKGSLDEAKLSHEMRNELRDVNYHGLLQSSIEVAPDAAWNLYRESTGASENFIYAMKQERAYAASLHDYDSYQSWKKNRNPKRAVMETKCGFDVKHASHLYRLATMGKEILEGKGVIVKRPDASVILDIKNGGWTYDQIEEYASRIDQELNDSYKKSTLPHHPDIERINDLCQEILSRELYADIAVKAIK